VTRPQARRVSARALAIAALLIGILAAAAFAVGQRGRENGAAELPDRTGEAPVLMLLTSLPLVFAENFGLEASGSPALDALERRYRVEPISTTRSAELRRSGLLLMAHPLAQTAEALVELDAWVRDGGRVLLLADPLLEWESERPLGDNLRPSPSFADTGLLAHWGLRLDLPNQRGPQERALAGGKVLTLSPGSLAGKCQVSPDGFVAVCNLGRGKATIVADADFLNVTAIGEAAEGNLRALLWELARLEQR
jgi:hypothetical protein